MKFRRVVTSTDADGKSYVLFDGEPAFAEPAPGLKSSDIWETQPAPFPLDTDKDAVDRPVRLTPPTRGTIGKAFTLPPYGTLPADFWEKLWESIDPEGDHDGGMHKTNSVDYVICVDGEVTCVLDRDTVVLKPGEVLIQHGAKHSWENFSDKPCTIFGVLVDAG